MLVHKQHFAEDKCVMLQRFTLHNVITCQSHGKDDFAFRVFSYFNFQQIVKKKAYAN